MRYLLTLILFSSFTAFSKNAPLANGSLSFIENKGQVTDQFQAPRTDIDFKMSGDGVSIFVGGGQIHYQWARPIGNVNTKTDDNLPTETVSQTEFYRMDVELVGCNKNAQLVLEDKQDYFENYYTATTDKDGAVCHSYRKATYKDVYPGIDWVIYIKGNKAEYEFVVSDGVDPSVIKLKYSGATQLNINKDGSLTATTPFGSVTEAAPYSYSVNGETITSSFHLKNEILSFNIAPYEGKLVIDPTLIWATYYRGDNGVLRVRDMARHGDTQLIYMGETESSNLATVGAFQQTSPTSPIMFISKFNIEGERIWATYYGCGSIDGGGVSCDPAGNIYVSGNSGVCGTTIVTTPGCHQPVYGGGTRDGFFAKFNNNGQRVWATFYGGAGNMDYVTSIAVDSAFSVFISGYTNSTTGISTPNSYLPNFGGHYDGFVAKFDSAGHRIWGTYWGGSQTDFAGTIITDHHGHLYICGETYTGGTTGILSTPGTHQQDIAGNVDGLLTKFDTAGTRIWATYYGGNGWDVPSSLALDHNGDLYMSGQTGHNTSGFNYVSYSGIATPGSYQPSAGGGEKDGFLVKFTNTGQRLWGTYIGGWSSDYLPQRQNRTVAVDDSNNVIVAGMVQTPNMATPGAFEETGTGGYDGFFAKFTTTGSIMWASYYAGGYYDELRCVLAYNDDIFIGGWTGSLDMPVTPGAFQTTNLPFLQYNGCFARFHECGIMPAFAITGDTTVCPNSTITLNVPAIQGVSTYNWELPGNFSGSSTTNTITVTVNDTGGTVKVATEELCISSDSINITVVEMPPFSIIGQTSICPASTFILSVPEVPGATTYTWNLPGTFTGNSSTDSITITAGNTSGIISVTANDMCSSTDTINITVVPLPQFSIVGDTAVCSGSTFILSVPQVPGATSYSWSLPGTFTGSSTIENITITVNNTGGTVNVTANDMCSSSDTVDITVFPLPQPIINVNGSLLEVANTYTSYQWYFNGNIIPGANTNTYPVGQAGDYAVLVTDNNGCSNTSPTVPAVPVSVSNISIADEFKVFPSPTDGRVTIKGKIQYASIKVFNSIGQVILSDVAQESEQYLFDISKQASGWYIIEVRATHGFYKFKVLKK